MLDIGALGAEIKRSVEDRNRKLYLIASVFLTDFSLVHELGRQKDGY